MAEDAMAPAEGGATTESTDATAKENVALEGDNKDIALAICAALVEANCTSFSMDASGDTVKVSMDGASVEFTAEEVASMVGGETGAEEEAAEGASA